MTELSKEDVEENGDDDDDDEDMEAEIVDRDKMTAAGVHQGAGYGHLKAAHLHKGGTFQSASANLDPSRRAFWRHLNNNFRSQANVARRGMQWSFDLDLPSQRQQLAAALRQGEL